MIDFRYHLVSLIAVLLALSIGIILGTGLFGDRFLKNLEGQVESLAERTREKQAFILEQKREIAQLREVEQALEAHVVGDRLIGREFVLLQFDGTDAALADGMREELESAGGEIVSTITFTDRLALADDIAFDQLALTMRSSAATPDELLEESAQELGSELAAAAAPAGEVPRQRSASETLEAVLADLEETGFVATEGAEEPVVAGSDFLILAGGDEAPGADVRGFTLALGNALTERGARVIAAETVESAWDVVAAIRDDATVRDAVTTVDHADTLTGRMAVVLALDGTVDGPAGHYGTDDGATELIPQPPPQS